MENDSNDTKIAISPQQVVTEELPKGKEILIWDLPAFPTTTKPVPYSPQDLFSGLKTYGDSQKGIKASLKEYGIDYWSFCELEEKYPEIQTMYRRARLRKARIRAEDTQELADLPLTGEVKEMMAEVRHRELQVKARQWLAERENRRDYGYKQQIETTTKSISLNLTADVGADVAKLSMSLEDLLNSDIQS